MEIHGRKKETALHKLNSWEKNPSTWAIKETSGEEPQVIKIVLQQGNMRNKDQKHGQDFAAALCTFSPEKPIRTLTEPERKHFSGPVGHSQTMQGTVGKQQTRL